MVLNHLSVLLRCASRNLGIRLLLLGNSQSKTTSSRSQSKLHGKNCENKCSRLSLVLTYYTISVNILFSISSINKHIQKASPNTTHEKIYISRWHLRVCIDFIDITYFTQNWEYVNVSLIFKQIHTRLFSPTMKH